ncbi:PEP-CTERM sorting domain-containing protein [Coraliomargarita parva]|uniref:PEP-CTERM sorting domain-containing protein n=1 Tax=Coraliomargarita parva TaxID=3014050 RepID=UPI0022B33507|nr:PEP-CTERM sorting domain-containing protein [Coraliomargarita parva]
MRKPTRISLLLGLLSTGSLLAQSTLYWDTNGATAGLGGDGSWQDGAGNWSTDLAGETSSTWSSAAPDIADFRGTEGTVTVDASGVSAQSLLFNVGGYTLAGTGSISFTTSTSYIVDWQAGAGTTSIQNDLVIFDDASLNSTDSYYIRNQTTGVLTLDGDLLFDYTDAASASGVKTVIFNTTDASGSIVLNGSVGAAPGSAQSRMYFDGPGSFYLNAASNVNPASSSAYGGMGNGTLYLGNDLALGTKYFGVGSSSNANELAIYTNGAYTINNYIELKGTNQATIGGATADLSTFSGRVNMSNTNNILSAADGGRVDFSGTSGAVIFYGKAVSKQGNGIVSLSRSAGNSGAASIISVDEGVLLLMNSSGSATGTTASMTVTDGATLGGTGSSTAAVVASAAGSIFSAGDMSLAQVSDIGTLTLSGGLTAANGATFKVDIDGASVDMVDFGTGVVDLDGVLTFDFTSLSSVQTGIAYSLFAGTGDWTGSSASFVFNGPDGYVLDSSYGGGNGYIFDAAGNSLTVQFAAVPEPATFALLAGGLGLLYAMARRRK